jgi:hypothetical protein
MSSTTPAAMAAHWVKIGVGCRRHPMVPAGRARTAYRDAGCRRMFSATGPGTRSAAAAIRAIRCP